MLELKPRKGEKYIETDRYPVIKILLESAWVPAELRGLPNVDYVIIDGSKVSLKLKFGESCGTINPQVFNKENKPHFFPFSHSYSSLRMGRGALEFQLGPDIKNMHAIFTGDKGLHRITDGIFGTEDVTEGEYPDYIHERVGRLEQNELDGVGDLEVELRYKTPFAAWRALPFEFLNNIYEFSFNNLSWPKKTGSYSEDVTELNVGFDLNREGDEREFIKGALKKTGLVKYTLEEGRTSFENKHHFSVKPEEIRFYGSLKKLEDVARELNPDKRDWESEVLVKGNLSRDAFALVPKIFDSGEVRVKGYVKGGDIKVSNEVQLNNASLEKISRLIQTGALNHCGLKLSLETDKWRTINFCEDTGWV